MAANLYKFIAYKDEYEVARLMLEPALAAQVAATFSEAVTVSYNLSPPAARTLGRSRKLRLGPWFRPAFQVLRAARRLRGTPLDPFARQRSRVEERELIVWYRDLLDEIVESLRPSTVSVAVALAELPEGIRGYEGVKSASAAAARIRGDELREQLRRPRLPLTTVS